MGMKFGALTRTEGTRAKRLSVIMSSVPVNTLLKPRTTMLLLAIPVFAKSTAGRFLTWSAMFIDGLLRMSAPSTTATEAGASRTFSCRREAETTLCSRKMTCSLRTTFSVVDRPACTETFSRISAL